MAALKGGDFQTCWPGKITWGLNQRLTNQLLKVILPNSKPVTLIIQIIMQVITCHDTCHMMAKQFFHNMWRRT